MIRTACCLALTLAFLRTSALAQGSVTIFGTVTDASGSVVPGVTIGRDQEKSTGDKVIGRGINRRPGVQENVRVRSGPPRVG